MAADILKSTIMATHRKSSEKRRVWEFGWRLALVAGLSEALYQDARAR